MKTLARFYLATLCLLAFIPSAHAACDNLTKGLAAYWRLDGNGHDSLGPYPRGTYPLIGTGVPYGSYVDGIIGLAMKQSGNNRSFQVKNGTKINLTKDFTLSFWAYRQASIYDNDAVFDNGAIYIAKRDAAPWNSRMGVYFYPSQGPQSVELIDNSGMGEPPLATWFHVVIFNKGGTAGIKVNNQGTATVSLAGLTLKNGPVVYIGQQQYGYPWQGSLDEFGIWDRALSDSEMTALYNRGKGWRLRP